MSHNHYGLEFLNQIEKSIHICKKNHNPYNSFVKRNTDILKELKISSYGFIKLKHY